MWGRGLELGEKDGGSRKIGMQRHREGPPRSQRQGGGWVPLVEALGVFASGGVRSSAGGWASTRGLASAGPQASA